MPLHCYTTFFPILSRGWTPNLLQYHDYAEFNIVQHYNMILFNVRICPVNENFQSMFSGRRVSSRTQRTTASAFSTWVLACMCCGSSLKIPCAFSHAHETLVNIFTDQFKLRWDDYKSIKSLRLHHWPVQALTGDAKARGLVMVDSPDCVHVQQGSDHYNLRRDFS